MDIYAEKKESNGKICKKVWVNGKISGIDPEANRGIYNVIYYKSDNKNSKCSIKFPKSTLEIDKKGTKTEYLENKFKLYNPNKLTIVDYCLETNKQKIWCTAKICDIDNETKDDELKFLKYKLDIENYDYNVIQENEVGFYDGMEQNGISISFDSYRIQKFKTFSDVQKKYFKLLNERKYDLADNYKSLLDFVLEVLENDQNIEEFYEYEKIEKDEGENNKKINYILGKYEKNYSFYFTKLLKAMADNNHFKIIIDILNKYDDKKDENKDKDKNKFNNISYPTIDEISTFFCILLNCTPFIHIKYYDDNYNVFKNAVFKVINNESEKNIMTKSTFYSFAFFLTKIHFLRSKSLINRYDEYFNLNEYIDELLLKLGLEMMKSQTFNIREIGLELILECVNYSVDEEENISILKVLNKEQKNEDFINLLFDKENYQTPFIKRSYKIIFLMLKYKTLDENKLEFIWNLVNEKNNDSELEDAVIELFTTIYENLETEISALHHLVATNTKSLNVEAGVSDKTNTKYLEEEKTTMNLLAQFCQNILNIILSKKNIQKNDSLYILKNKLALKVAGGDEFNQKIIKEVEIECCNYFIEKILEEKDLKKLEKNNFLEEVIKYFSFGENFYIQIIQKYINNLNDASKGKKTKENILIIIASFHKILEKQKDISKIFQYLFKNKKISFDSEYLDEKIFMLLFENTFERYKELVKKQMSNKKENENEKEINERKNNIKIFIDFLMKILPDIFKKQENTMDNIDYNSNENAKGNTKGNTKEDIIDDTVDYIKLLKKMSLDEPIDATNAQLFYDYIEIFVDDKNKYKDDKYKGRKEKEIFDIINNKTNNSNMTIKQIKLYIRIFCDINKDNLIKEGEKLKLKGNAKLDSIEDLWNMYLNMNVEELSKELYLFIYDLYNDNDKTEILLDKCLNGIFKLKYDDNGEKEKNDNKLEQYINMINYIISKSEEGKIIHIKSHRDILKECIMNIPIILNNNTSNKFDEINEEKIDLFYGNANLYELNKVLHDKYDNNASNIKINIIDKNGNLVQKSLNSTLNSIRENSENIIFVGNEIKSLPFETNKGMNPKFKKMFEDWFYQFSNGKEEMNEEDINKFKEKINNKEIIIDNNNEIKLILKEDFIKLYEKLSRDEPDFVWENIKKMKYLNNFEKIQENKIEEIEKKENLKKYKLGNNGDLYNTLLKIFLNTNKKYLIYNFLNTLCTNKNKYDEILNNFENVLNKEKNCLEYSYELTIIESIIHDLEISQVNVSDIFNIKKEDEVNKIHFNKSFFDDDENIERKKKFMLTFIKQGNIYIDKLLDKIGGIFTEYNEIDNDFYNELFIQIFKLVDFMQNIYDQKLFYEINNVINSVYELNGHNVIKKDKIFENEINIEEENISNFNMIILKLFNLFFNHKYLFYEKTYKYTFNILLNTKNFEETLPGEPRKEIDDEENEEEVEGDDLMIFDLL